RLGAPASRRLVTKRKDAGGTPALPGKRGLDGRILREEHRQFRASCRPARRGLAWRGQSPHCHPEIYRGTWGKCGEKPPATNGLEGLPPPRSLAHPPGDK